MKPVGATASAPLFQGAPSQTEPILRARMPELDSLRGIAILMVVVYHFFYWTIAIDAFSGWERLFLVATAAGRFGVNLFFVLSGFLITTLLLDARPRADYYKRFYTRRALRILPIFLCTIMVLAILRYNAVFLLLSLAYVANLAPLFGVRLTYPVLWSLAVEEHFYLVWPAIVRHLSRRALLAVSIGIIAASPIIRYLSFLYSSVRPYQWAEYTWNSADGLACGAAVAILVREWGNDRTKLRRLAWSCGAAAILLFVFGSPFGILSHVSPVGAMFQVVPWHFAFVSMLGAFLLIGTSSFKRMVQSRVLEFFGYISYGLYLIHMLVKDGFDDLASRIHVLGMGHGPMPDLAVRFFYGGAAATFIAWLSRKYFEDRFLRLKQRPAGVPQTNAEMVATR